MPKKLQARRTKRQTEKAERLQRWEREGTCQYSNDISEKRKKRRREGPNNTAKKRNDLHGALVQLYEITGESAFGEAVELLHAYGLVDCNMSGLRRRLGALEHGIRTLDDNVPALIEYELQRQKDAGHAPSRRRAYEAVVVGHGIENSQSFEAAIKSVERIYLDYERGQFLDGKPDGNMVTLRRRVGVLEYEIRATEEYIPALIKCELQRQEDAGEVKNVRRACKAVVDDHGIENGQSSEDAVKCVERIYLAYEQRMLLDGTLRWPDGSEKHMRVKPVAGKKIIDPKTRQPLPQQWVLVPNNRYWRKQLERRNITVRSA